MSHHTEEICEYVSVDNPTLKATSITDVEAQHAANVGNTDYEKWEKKIILDLVHPDPPPTDPSTK